MSAGQVLRNSGQFQEILARGELVDDMLTVEIMAQEMAKIVREGKNVILDGFPRDVEQAVWMADNIAEVIEEIIIIDVPKDELLRRLASWDEPMIIKRRLCKDLRLLSKIWGESLKFLVRKVYQQRRLMALARQMKFLPGLKLWYNSAMELERKINAMRAGGKILGGLLRDLKDYIQPGMTGKDIDAWVRAEIARRGAKVAYDYLEEDFPGAICISVNDVLVHGAPNDEPLEEGDKVSFDLDILYQGYYTDSAFTMLVGGQGSPAVKEMIKTTEKAMWAGIDQVRPGARIGDISYAVEKVLA